MISLFMWRGVSAWRPSLEPMLFYGFVLWVFFHTVQDTQTQGVVQRDQIIRSELKGVTAAKLRPFRDQL